MCLKRFAQADDRILDIRSFDDVYVALKKCVKERVYNALRSIIRTLENVLVEMRIEELDYLTYSSLGGDNLLSEIVSNINWPTLSNLMSDLETYVPNLENRVYITYDELTPLGKALEKWWYDESEEALGYWVSLVMERAVKIIHSQIDNWENTVQEAVEEYAREHNLSSIDDVPSDFWVQFDENNYWIKG